MKVTFEDKASYDSTPPCTTNLPLRYEPSLRHVTGSAAEGSATHLSQRQSKKWSTHHFLFGLFLGGKSDLGGRAFFDSICLSAAEPSSTHKLSLKFLDPGRGGIPWGDLIFKISRLRTGLWLGKDVTCTCTAAPCTAIEEMMHQSRTTDRPPTSRLIQPLAKAPTASIPYNT